MKYTMKAGILSVRNQVAARIRSSFTGPEKIIYSADGTLLLRADVCQMEAPPEKQGDVRFRQYQLSDSEKRVLTMARPDYAQAQDPSLTGWPLCRVPRVDHARLVMGEKTYDLFMKNSQNYLMKEPSGKTVLQIFHLGLAGGWEIETEDYIKPELVCGIFIFCRYMELENELLVV